MIMATITTAGAGNRYSLSHLKAPLRMISSHGYQMARPLDDSEIAIGGEAPIEVHISLGQAF